MSPLNRAPASVIVVDPPQLSDALGSIQDTTAPQVPASVETVKSSGRPTIAGGWLSTTITVNVHMVGVVLLFDAV